MRSELCERLKAPRVAKYFPSLEEKVGFNTNVSMFVEDVHLTVMPIGGKSRLTPNFSVDIQAIPDHQTRAITILESLTDRARYIRHNLEKLLSTLVQDIARELARNGRSVHEIVQDEENDGEYRLYSFTSQRLFRVFGRYIQIIPKADRSLWKKAYVIIPERYIWDIAMPKELGGCRGYRALLRKLARFEHPSPKFWIDDLSKLDWSGSFDSQRYLRETEISCATIMERWGWNQRDYSQRNCTEFYLVHRTLQFKWALAVIREHIMHELNRLFQRLNIEAKIVMKGLPTASEILAIRQQMSEGDISFMEALDACSV